MPEHLFIYLFFECLGIQFFNSLTCDLQDTIPRGDRHFKHVASLTYLIYLPLKELYVQGLFKRYSYLAMKYNVSYEI